MQSTELNTLLKNLATQLALCNLTEHEALTEAWMLLENITGKSKAALLADHDLVLTSEQSQRLTEWLDQRIRQRKALYYVLGALPFYNVEIFIQPPILIPRPETEEWVTWLIDQLTPVAHVPLAVLDLCTGSGCIALALAKSLPQAQVVGIDINPNACDLAEKNKQHNSITNATFVQSDLFSSCSGMSFDLIVANPPYIAKSEYETLQPEILAWEDERALVAGQEGLAFYEWIAQEARTYLKPNSVIARKGLPSLVVEVGQKPERVVSIFVQHGYRKATLYKDIRGAGRWVGVWV